MAFSKRFLSCLMSAVLVVGLMPAPAFGRTMAASTGIEGADGGEAPAAAVAGDVASGEVDEPALMTLDAVGDESPAAERLLLTRPTQVGATVDGDGKSTLVFTKQTFLTQDELDGKELTVRFTGDEPRMRVREDGIGARGVSAWLYWADNIAPTSVEDAYVDSFGDQWKIAHFSAETVADAWSNHAVPLNDAYEKADSKTKNIVVEKGDYGKFFITAQTTDGEAACTIDRIALVGGEVPQHPGKTDPKLAVSGKSAQDIVKAMKAGWNLGNTFDAYAGNGDGPYAQPDRADVDVERFWGNPRTSMELLEFVHDQGFNAVRIPVSWFQHIYSDGVDPEDNVSVYHIDEAWLTRVHEVVDYAYDLGMYITLNTHHEKLWLETPTFGDASEYDQKEAEFTAIWRQVATEFADYDQRLVFEGLNEPRATGEGIDHDREWGSPTVEDLVTLNKLNQAFVDTVRSVDSPYRSTRLLLVPTMSGATSLPMITQVKVPTLSDGKAIDPYVGISAHPYQPWWFTSSTDEYQDHVFGDRNEVALEQVLYRMFATFSSKGVPVVLDEFGASDFGNTDERVKWMQRYIDLARSYGMTCFIWDGGSMAEQYDESGELTQGVSAYIDRHAIPVKWANKRQERVMQTFLNAASNDTAQVEWRSAFGTVDVPDATGEIEGLRLNDETFKVENVKLESGQTQSTYRDFDVRWNLIEGGDVAITFTGDAPKLVMTNKNGGGWTEMGSGANGLSYVAWNEDATGGTAYFWASQIERLWLLGSDKDKGTANQLDDLRRFLVYSGGTSTTVSRVVLTGFTPPSVGNGAYRDAEGNDITVRRLYTRPFRLENRHDADGNSVTDWNTVAINTENPDVVGKDFAVRFTGTTPYLIFVDMGTDHAWHGWTSVRPYMTVSADDDTAQKVAFFSWSEIEAAWNANDAAGGAGWTFDSVSIGVSGEGSVCDLVELVSLNADVIEHPAADSRYQDLTAREIVDRLYAGYNLGGHLESNYVPSKTPKDGGWGDADLDLEAHWSRGVYISRETIKGLRDDGEGNGFKTIRIPVSWFQHVYSYDDGTGVEQYHIDRAWMERVHEIVDWCIAEDLFVILNMHHEPWIENVNLDTNYEVIKPQFEAIWRQIADEFSGYDQRLIFEGMNEPHAEGDPTDREWNQPKAGDIATINALNQDFVSLMRSMPAESGHQNRLLMVPTYAASSSLAANRGFQMPDDPSGRTVISLHNYTPHSYTHYLQNKPETDDGSANVFTDSYKEAVDASFERIRSLYTNRGYLVVLGEFGVYYNGEERQADRLEWMTRYVTHAKELGIPCIYWRMDRAVTAADGSEVMQWSVFDEVAHEWSSLSSEIMGKWFDVLDDDDVAWGGRATMGAAEHADIASGIKLVGADGKEPAWPATLDYSDEGKVSWRTGRLSVSWEGVEATEGNPGLPSLQGREIAVEFTGGQPRLALLNNWDGYWWGIDPSYVDTSKGIAYYSVNAIAAAWREKTGLPLTDLHYVCIRADENLTVPDLEVKSAALIHEHDWGYWEYDEHADGCCGVETRTCSTCDETEKREKHDWGRWTTEVAPKCDTAGVEVRVCKVDGAHSERRPIAATGHQWGWVVTEEAMCEADGVKTATCSVCGATKTAAVKALGHDWVDSYAWSDAFDSVQVTRVCSRDSAHTETYETEVIASAITKQPTCTEPGEATYKATFDEPGFSDTVEKVVANVPATGHKLTAHAAHAATVDKEGNAAYWACSVCGRHFSNAAGTSEIEEGSWIVPALGRTSLAKAVVTLDKSAFTYDGKAHKPTVKSVVLNKKTIPKSGYEVFYSSGCTKAGSYKVTVTGLGAYSGTVMATFTIDKAKLSTMTLSSVSFTYNGEARLPKVTVRNASSKALVADQDYTLEVPKGRVNVGTYRLRAVGKGNYTGSLSTTFRIGAKKLSPSVKLAKTKYVYSGKANKPSATVKASGKKLSSSAYKVKYSGGTNVGKGTVTVQLTGNYSGSAKATFTVAPKGTSLAKVSSAKRGFTAKWKKQAKQVDGYQVQYATSKSFKGAKTTMVKGASATSKRITKLSSGKKYWVRVRTFKAAAGTTYYSSWSKASTVKTS